MKKCVDPTCGKQFKNTHGSQIYCNSFCQKHAWYIKNTPNSNHYKVHKKFWETQTGIGFYWEIQGAKLLGATHTKFGKGCDLVWGSKLVDVKACNVFKRKKQDGKLTPSTRKGVWIFNRNKEKPCDFFLCYCLESNKPVKILLIPAISFPKSGITIGETSKYDKFIYPSVAL